MKKRFFPLLSCVLLAPLSAFAMSAQDVVSVVTSFLQTQTRELPGTVSVSVVPPNDHQQILQTCMQAQAFLPQGQKAWGRVTVGLRCVSGPNASLYVSAKVSAQGSYVKVARTVPGGQVLSEGDLQIEQGELTSHPDDLVLTLRDAVGRTTRQALSPGQALRNAYLQQDVGIRAGQSVTIVAKGNGFSVVNRGKAINSAARGALIRVKLDSGQIISGVALNGDTVDVSDH